MREIDTHEYFTMIKELLAAGETVSLLITGNSMYPFLKHLRDTIWLSPITKDPVAGDMLLYQRRSGQYVMHRLVRVGQDGYYFCGDAQWSIEGPLARDQLLAVVEQVEVKGRILKPGCPRWWFYRHVWRRIIGLRRWLLAVAKTELTR